jgi:hypothetical protein
MQKWVQMEKNGIHQIHHLAAQRKCVLLTAAGCNGGGIMLVGLKVLNGLFGSTLVKMVAYVKAL